MKSEIEKKKNDIVRNIEELQDLLESEYGGSCRISIEVDYCSAQVVDFDGFKDIITSIDIKCSVVV